MQFLKLVLWPFPFAPSYPLLNLQLQDHSPSYSCNITVLFYMQAQDKICWFICQNLSRLFWLQEIKLLLQTFHIVTVCLSGNNAMSWMPDLLNQNSGFMTRALCCAWLALLAHATHHHLNKLPSSHRAIKPLCITFPSLLSRLVIAESRSTCTDNIPNRISCRKEKQGMEYILLPKMQKIFSTCDV